MYKTEPHVHTREVSPCGHLRGILMAEYHKEAGYDTIIIADHLSRSIMDSYGDIPWRDKVTVYFSGYYKAKQRGKLIGLNVIPSAELQLVGPNREKCVNHYLLYGFDRSFFDDNPQILDMTIEEFYPLAKSYGIYVVQAHPAREKCTPRPEFVDAFEVFNSRRTEEENEIARVVAEQYNLPQTAGSDCHKMEHLFGTAVLSDYEIKTAEDYVNLLKNRQAVIYKPAKQQEEQS